MAIAVKFEVICQKVRQLKLFIITNYVFRNIKIGRKNISYNIIKDNYMFVVFVLKF